MTTGTAIADTKSITATTAIIAMIMIVLGDAGSGAVGK